ncbi:alpha/beta fold hydrolase [Ramlibacter humi]|uniref:Alpha/beta hydrolase n=1 Tax=Ramlibacter humi TaxID=2530451 RepID=A0A4Z0BM58_9BURK|nr:alpha/beta hydrolase [Ramlibacter humi]TFY99018.1 alpha/beta hydrolase [Ramlibacter humi]
MIQRYLQDLPHGITLSCRATGERGRPTLVFLHGFPEAAFVWDELLEHFAKPENGGYRCVAPNLRGFERSSSPADVSAYRAKHLVQDIAALIAIEGGPLECLVAHDWGGAVAWNIANQLPQLAKRLAIVNSPHPGTFLRDLKSDPAQQEASAYMNFLIRPDAEQLLAQDDYRRLWGFFTAGNEAKWLTEPVRQQYREVWNGPQGGSPGAGLAGGCNYYRASPLRPPRPEDPAAANITIPHDMLTVKLPTLVLWAMEDVALPPGLVEGLDGYVDDLTLERVPGATHWIVHERPAFVAERLGAFLRRQ